MRSGADRLAAALVRLGVTHVFGVPGTQSIQLFAGFRRGALRTVLTTHELNAVFMAAGFYRAAGRPAVVASIPGPGFTHALSGLVEARHDSTALLHIVGPPPAGPGRRFRLQAVDQAAIAQRETKGVFAVETVARLEETVHAAWMRATSGEPGPVVLHVPEAVLADSAAVPRAAGHADEHGTVPRADLQRAAAMLARARRPILFVGQGALGAEDLVVRLAETLGAPVVSSCSGRGIVPDDHRLALRFDPSRSSVDVLNEGLTAADCILVLGYKLTHNGTAGFRMQLRSDALVHVDRSSDTLGANYPASHAIVADVQAAVPYLLDVLANGASHSAWTDEELADWRTRLEAHPTDDTPEPRVVGASPATAERFFALLRDALPREAIVVTDSGLHQVLVRRHYPVYAPRGLIMPADYQSMGFGIPAAIGARLAAPERPVVAVIGDGGFAMTGFELLTAVREEVSLSVIVFNDGFLNLIRLQQAGASGGSTAVQLRNPDFEMLAHAIGAEYHRFDRPESLGSLADPDHRGVRLLEVRLGDSSAIRSLQVSGFVRTGVRRALGPRLVQRVKRWLRRS